MRTFTSAEELLAAAGETLGTSDWAQVTQEAVNTFADATGDHQWIHVDVDRATAESPFKGPIAHGFLTLSMLPMLNGQIYTVEGTTLALNYGLNKVRFPAPVPVGSRIRATSVLSEVTEVAGGGLQLVVATTVECEGAAKPVCVAESVSRLHF